MKLTRDWLFIHVPRTGGRSISEAIGENPIAPNHYTLSDWINNLGEEVVTKKFVFSTVRNPWERAVSWYSFFTPKQEFQTPFQFNQWVLQRNQYPLWPKGLTSLDHMSFYKDTQGNDYPLDYYLRFEHLQEDFAALNKQLHFPNPLGNIGTNDTLASNYKNYYTTKEAVDYIASLNQQLITKFNYTF